MSREDFVVVHVAASNWDAQTIAKLLVESGIDAYAIEDHSPGGMYALGTIAELHRPLVYVHPQNAVAAQSLVVRYEAGTLVIDRGPQPLFCYHCGAECSPPAKQCSACGSQLEWPGETTESEEISDLNPTFLENMRNLKKPLSWIFVAPLVATVAVFVLAVLAAMLHLF